MVPRCFLMQLQILSVFYYLSLLPLLVLGSLFDPNLTPQESDVIAIMETYVDDILQHYNQKLEEFEAGEEKTIGWQAKLRTDMCKVGQTMTTIMGLIKVIEEEPSTSDVSREIFVSCVDAIVHQLDDLLKYLIDIKSRARILIQLLRLNDRAPHSLEDMKSGIFESFVSKLATFAENSDAVERTIRSLSAEILLPPERAHVTFLLEQVNNSFMLIRLLNSALQTEFQPPLPLVTKAALINSTKLVTMIDEARSHITTMLLEMITLQKDLPAAAVLNDKLQTFADSLDRTLTPDYQNIVTFFTNYLIYKLVHEAAVGMILPLEPIVYETASINTDVARALTIQMQQFRQENSDTLTNLPTALVSSHHSQYKADVIASSLDILRGLRYSPPIQTVFTERMSQLADETTLKDMEEELSCLKATTFPWDVEVKDYSDVAFRPERMMRIRKLQHSLYQHALKQLTGKSSNPERLHRFNDGFSIWLESIREKLLEHEASIQDLCILVKCPTIKEDYEFLCGMAFDMVAIQTQIKEFLARNEQGEENLLQLRIELVCEEGWWLFDGIYREALHLFYLELKKLRSSGRDELETYDTVSLFKAWRRLTSCVEITQVTEELERLVTESNTTLVCSADIYGVAKNFMKDFDRLLTLVAEIQLVLPPPDYLVLQTLHMYLNLFSITLKHRRAYFDEKIETIQGIVKTPLSYLSNLPFFHQNAILINYSE